MLPNILWICTDQQRYDTIGASGNPYVKTPRLDDLCREGTYWTHGFCQSPICTPSRASFLTGTYPSTCQNTRNGNIRYRGRYPLITRLLANAGYDCGLIGKLHLAGAYERPEPRSNDGYRYWRWSHAPRDGWPSGHAYAEWVQAQGYDLNELIKDPAGVPKELHQTTWCADQTISFVTERRPAETPWLATVNIYDPHEPFNPPAEYRNRFDPANMPGPLFRLSDLRQQRRLSPVDFQSKARNPTGPLDIAHPVLSYDPGTDSEHVPDAGTFARDAKTLKAAYYAMIALIDDQVGRMLDALEESGQAENTLVIFTSDHGESLGDHGLIRKGCRFYEGLVRVPLILRWPNRIEPGRVCNDLVELTDLAPTLLAAADQPKPPWMQGISLLDRHTSHKAVRTEYFDATNGPDSSYATMYRTPSHKLVVYHGHELGELYDLDADPGEFDDLWDDPGSAALKSELLLRSFDASIRAAVDVGEKRVGPM